MAREEARITFFSEGKPPETTNELSVAVPPQFTLMYSAIRFIDWPVPVSAAR